jgi:hypothetical protein
VEYQKEEEIFIEEVEKVIRFDDPKPPEWWADGDTLRFIYEYDWNHNLVCEVRKISKKRPLTALRKSRPTLHGYTTYQRRD